MSKDDYDNSQPPYAIGYGKPPQEHRFKPGRSGNPRGRPKGTKDLNKLLQIELDRKVAVTERGRKRSISARELIAKQFVASALKGDLKKIEMLFKASFAGTELEPIEFDATADADIEDYAVRLLHARRKEEDDAQAKTAIEGSDPDDDVPD